MGFRDRFRSPLPFQLSTFSLCYFLFSFKLLFKCFSLLSFRKAIFTTQALHLSALRCIATAFLPATEYTDRTGQTGSNARLTFPVKRDQTTPISCRLYLCCHTKFSPRSLKAMQLVHVNRMSVSLGQDFIHYLK